MVPALALAALLASGATAEPRRFLLAVGQNHGDPADPSLSYAETDARSVASVFEETGGVQTRDAELLLNASVRSLDDALARLQAKLIREAGPQDRLFIYVSSHADEGDLHLDGQRFRVAKLRDFLQRAPVGVAVLILDSCRSGAATRQKGFRALRTVVSADTSSRVRGRVIIASSSQNESSQESDALQGSFFTSHWVAALRGMADSSGDGVVTLEEAYAYAYQRTVESTFSTAGGVQHPSFSMELRGAGQLVLSEPRRVRSQLVIDVAAPGEYLVKERTRGVVVSHFFKPEGAVKLALAPGTYHVLAREETARREGDVQLGAAGSASLREEDLREVRSAPVLAVLKGGSVKTPLSFGVFGGVGQGVFSELSVLRGGAVHAHGGLPSPFTFARPVWMVAVDYFAGEGTGRATFSQQELSGVAGLGLRRDLGRVALVAGVEGGLLWTRQLDAPAPLTERSAWSPQLAGTVELQVAVGAGFAVALSGWGGPAWVHAETGTAPHLRAGAGLGVAFNP